MWLTTVAIRRVRPKTYESYEAYIRVHLKPALGRHRLNQLQPEHLEAYYLSAQRKGLAPSTILHHHRVLSRALKIAVQRGQVSRNVATLVDAPSVPKTEVVPLTQGEAKRLMAAAVGRPNAARWSVALALGLRQGEALGLAWSDIDFELGSLTVRQALQRQRIRHGCEGEACGFPPKSARNGKAAW